MGQINLATSVLNNRLNLNGVYGYLDPYPYVFDISNNFTPLEPKPARFDFTDNTNWFIKLSYPFTSTKDHILISDKVINGILILGIREIIINSIKYLVFETTIKHNLSTNNNVRVKITDGLISNTFSIYGIGDENGNNKEYCFIVVGNLNKYKYDISKTRIIRLFGTRESEYYIRKFKEIDLYPDTTRMSVSSNQAQFYNYQTVFQKALDFSISGLTDNKDRPITSLYCLIQKKEGDFFTSIKSGFELNPNITGFTSPGSNKEYSDIHRIHTRLSGVITETDDSVCTISDSDTTFFGDICEWNDFEFYEYSLSDFYHRFNTNNREYTLGKNGDDGSIIYKKLVSKTPYNGNIIHRNVIINYDLHENGDWYGITNNFLYKNGVYTNPSTPGYNDYYYYYGNGSVITDSTMSSSYINVEKLEGYIYKPFYEIKIREFSNEITESYTGTTVDYNSNNYLKPPTYSVNVGGGRFIWRELLDPNSDSIKLPLTNDSFYSTTTIKFDMKRQDPFGIYKLRDDNDPYYIDCTKHDYSNLPKSTNTQQC